MSPLSYSPQVVAHLTELEIKQEQELSRAVQHERGHVRQRGGHAQEQGLMANPYVRSVNAEESRQLDQRLRTSEQPRSFAGEIAARRQQAELEAEQPATART